MKPHQSELITAICIAYLALTSLNVWIGDLSRFERPTQGFHHVR